MPKKIPKLIQKQEFESRTLQIDRVTRVTEGGKHLRFRAAVVIGDKKGRVGFGLKKGIDVAIAIDKALFDAKKNIINVPITKQGTIPYPIEAKFKSAKLFLKPAPKGTGIVAGSSVRVILELSGIQNVVAKLLGVTKNKINNAKVTIKALKKLEEMNKVKSKSS